jgi:hypothetical protein
MGAEGVEEQVLLHQVLDISSASDTSWTSLILFLRQDETSNRTCGKDVRF